jgi:hypothetical protein
MALRLRRGTDAERLLITPVEGELIYTTDTKLLYAGDGSTAGGNVVTDDGAGGATTLDALTDTDLTGAVGDDVLTYNAGTSKWEAVAVPGVGVLALTDLSDVDTAGLTAADIIQYDGVNFITASVQEAVGVGGALTIQTTGLHTGNVVGTVDGELNGSVFGDDSSIIIDGINHTIYTSKLSLNENEITFTASEDRPITISNGNRTPVEIKGVTNGTLGGFPYTDFNSVKGSIETPSVLSAGDIVGGWKITGYTEYDEENELPVSKITGMAIGSFDSTANLADEFPKSDLDLFISAGGTSYQIFNFNSIGQFTAPGPIKPGVFADATARDAAITAPEAGMMVFVTDVTKFQGYDGSAWVNLN